MRVGDLLEGQARSFPRRPALVFGDREYSFSQLDKRANQIAQALLALGVKPSQRVAIDTLNRPEWVEVFFGAAKAGVILVPINFRLGPLELADILESCQPRVLFFEAETASKVEAARPKLSRSLTWIEIGSRSAGWALDYEAWLERAAPQAPAQEAVDFEESAPHSICYTSGTTGKPRGAVLTHRNVVIGTHYMSVANLGYSRHDRFLNPTPLCHRAGWARLIQSVGVGATQVLARKFEPELLLRAIEEHRITMTGLVPTMVRMLDRARLPDLSSMRQVLTTGEACPPPVKQSLRELFPEVELICSFASTEAGLIALSSSRDPDYDPEATGRPLPEMELRIEREEILVRCGQPGRAGVMLSYWNDAQANTEAFDGDWFRTGDCGALDERGLLFLSDRKKDMIVTGGLNVSSKEVESALLEHPAIRQAAVVAKEDPVFGESVTAFVVPRRAGAVSEAELVSHCKAQLASYKKPRDIRFVSELPQNAAGKILKYRLREQLRGERTDRETATGKEER